MAHQMNRMTRNKTHYRTWKRGKSWLFATTVAVAVTAGAVATTGVLAQADVQGAPAAQSGASTKEAPAAWSPSSASASSQGSAATSGASSVGSSASSVASSASSTSSVVSSASSTSSVASSASSTSSAESKAVSSGASSVASSGSGSSSASSSSAGSSSASATSSASSISVGATVTDGAFQVRNTAQTVGSTWNPLNNYVGVTINGKFYAKTADGSLNLPAGYVVNYQDNVITADANSFAATKAGTYTVQFTLLDSNKKTLSTGKASVMVVAAANGTATSQGSQESSAASVSVMGKDLTIAVGGSWSPIDNYVGATINGQTFGVTGGKTDLPSGYSIGYSQTVNTKVPGTYSITYNLTDSSGKVIATTTNKVIVAAPAATPGKNTPGSTTGGSTAGAGSAAGQSGANVKPATVAPLGTGTASHVPSGSSAGTARVTANAANRAGGATVRGAATSKALPSTGDESSLAAAGLAGGGFLAGAVTLVVLRRRRSQAFDNE